MSKRGLHRSVADLPLLPAVVIVPFISWGASPWLMGVFAFLVVVVFFLDHMKVRSAGSYPLFITAAWIPFLALYALTLYHMARSPVPYLSLLFLTQLTLSLVFYHLLLAAGARIPTLSIVLVWVGVLVPWVLFQGLAAGVRAPGGPFFNPNYLATVVLSCLAFIVGLRTDTREKGRVVWLSSAAALMCTAALLLIGSRSAAIGTVIVWVVFSIRSKGLKRWIALAVVAFVFLAPSTVRHRVTQEYRVDPHAFTRIDIWQAALRMGADHPVFGVGPNLFYEYAPVYAFPTDDLPVRYGRIVRKPHNEYLRAWAEGGIVGVAAALLFLLVTLRLLVRAWVEGRSGPAMAMGAILYQALFHDITEVFALMALAVWWLAQLTPGGTRRMEVEGKRSLLPAVIVVLLLTGSAIWLSLDVASRARWVAAQRLMSTQAERAASSLTGSLHLNPLHPGAARDLAQAHFDRFRNTGLRQDYERAEESIRRAWKLDRMDSVPLRLQAALYVELARQAGDGKKQVLPEALGLLHRAAALEPHNALIMLNTADLYWELGRRQQALDQIEKALTTEPNYLAAHRKRIAWLAELDPARLPWAQGELEKAASRATGYTPNSLFEEIILR